MASLSRKVTAKSRSFELLTRNVSARVQAKPNHTLSQDKLDFYYKHGYLLIEKLFDDTVLDRLRQRFSDVCNGDVKSGITIIKERSLATKHAKPEDYINKVQDLLHDEDFMSYSEDPRLLGVVSRLLGTGELIALNSMMINKPPGTMRHPAHQDQYYLPIRPSIITAAWTAIDRATLDNGCLFCIPGSHKKPLRKHELHQECKTFFHKVSDEERIAPVDQRISFEMEPGDTVFFHPLLVHGSGPNMSQKHRKAMIVHYMSSRCRYVDVTGSAQESVLGDYRRLVTISAKNVHATSTVRYEDFWKARSKAMPKIPAK